jgi:hypothetical protein
VWTAKTFVDLDTAEFTYFGVMSIKAYHYIMHCPSVFCRVVALPANLDFMTFNHRGKLFAPELEAKFTKS